MVSGQGPSERSGNAKAPHERRNARKTGRDSGFLIFLIPLQGAPTLISKGQYVTMEKCLGHKSASEKKLFRWKRRAYMSIADPAAIQMMPVVAKGQS